jgi:hypothetical protein
VSHTTIFIRLTLILTLTLTLTLTLIAKCVAHNHFYTRLLFSVNYRIYLFCARIHLSFVRTESLEVWMKGTQSHLCVQPCLIRLSNPPTPSDPYTESSVS